MPAFANIAAYRFARLTDLKSLRERLLGFCRERELKGTILLSPEGVNLFVAGVGGALEELLDELRAIPGLEGLEAKWSESHEQPFRRMLVRLKKEIIAFGVEGIDPATRTSPKLPARTLKQWLDEGRELTLLDTRNDYEVKLGTFKGALPAGIDHFRDFPKAVASLPETMKKQPIVMFCTGGIRCEKAGPFMEREGFEEVYQLDGGILKYFEECGGDHYEGECFVFDQRVGVDPALTETGSSQCYVCQTPLTDEEQRDPRFVVGKSCPYCFQTTEQQMREAIATRESRFREVTSPLPGGVPYENRRPIHVPGDCDGWTLIDFLCEVGKGCGREGWSQRIDSGALVSRAGERVDPQQVVRGGEQFVRRTAAAVEPDVNPAVHILHEDEAIVVVDKPAPLPMHPGGRFNRNTLQFFMEAAYAPQKPRPAHRLDANTSGVVVFTRTRHFASRLQPQFQRCEVEKTYLVKVDGQPVDDAFICEAKIGAQPEGLGARRIDEAGGLEARTEFRLLKRLADGTSLVEARPKTGRTNQIRLHLWHLDLPIIGDPCYLSGGRLGEAQTLPVDASPMCLHAWKVGFTHPLTKAWVCFEAPLPEWSRGELVPQETAIQP